MTHNQKALDTAIWAGEILLKNGAEISRVQGTIAWFLESFGITDHNVYVISNGIFVTIDETGENPGHAVRTINSAGTHLGRIEAVNELSREIAVQGTKLGMDVIRGRLKQCESLGSVPFWGRLLAGAAGSAGFCYIMGGSPWDSAAAFAAGLLLQAFLTLCARMRINRFITNIIGGSWVTLLAWLMLAAGLGTSLDSVIIGSIIALVPGVLLTTSIRDFFNSDYVSGVIHLIESLIIAACIAVGVGWMLSLIGAMGGVGL